MTSGSSSQAGGDMPRRKLRSLPWLPEAPLSQLPPPCTLHAQQKTKAASRDIHYMLLVGYLGVIYVMFTCSR